MGPVLEQAEVVGDLASALIDGGEVDFRGKLDLRSLRWVVLAACDNEHEDAHVEVGVGWADDGAVPVGE